MSYPARDPLTRWWEKVDKRGPDECWPWKGGTWHYGHGRFFVVGFKSGVMAHRWGYGQLVGPVAASEMVCHTCDNPPCCNPRHWFKGTANDNMQDKVRKGRQAKGKQITANRDRMHAVGERNPNAKVTKTDVLAIRGSVKSVQELATAYGISPTQVYRIRKGESWNC